MTSKGVFTRRLVVPYTGINTAQQHGEAAIKAARIEAEQFHGLDVVKVISLTLRAGNLTDNGDFVDLGLVLDAMYGLLVVQLLVEEEPAWECDCPA